MKVVVIGGGAAGFFAAINCALFSPGNEVILIEKSNKLLAKVRISGGGRCNVTHNCPEPRLLVQNYPRGARELLSAFNAFGPTETIQWFEERGVVLKTEADGRMFPVTDNSETIIDCLMNEARVCGVKIWTGITVNRIVKTEDRFDLELSDQQLIACNKLVVASGGHPNESSFNWIKDLGHSIVSPVPSLFTFNIPEPGLHLLAGVSVPIAEVRVQSSKLLTSGPLLITHWGMSGPAILKCSAWGARLLADLKYDFTIAINWIPGLGEEDLREKLSVLKVVEARKQVSAFSPFPFPQRLWEFLLGRAGVNTDLKWADLSKKDINKLIEEVIRGAYKVKGKTTFKEEFVTCGGVKLVEVNFKTMESRISKNLYFAGEVLDIDGITGGFNFQNAWTTAFIAAKAIADKSSV